MGAAGAGAGMVFLIILLALYFIPSIIALMRSHKDMPAIAAINILLGWTFIGWFVSFIWSLSDPKGRNATQTVIVQANPTIHTPAAPAPAPTASSGDADTDFWDTLKGQSDPDGLEEYLIRFPSGKFSGLARTRLARLSPPTAGATE